MKPVLYIMCGLPGSGKSSFARQMLHVNNTIYYASRDAIRLSIITDEDKYFSKEKEVFNIYIDNIVTALKNGQDVIADATHLNLASRKKLTNAIDKYFNNYYIFYIIFNTELETCLERNAKRDGRAYVPPETIHDMMKHFYPPKEEDIREMGRIQVT